MSSLPEAMKNMKFDRRMLEYNLSQGLITKEEWQKYLSSLGDSKDNAIPVEFEEEKGQETH